MSNSTNGKLLYLPDAVVVRMMPPPREAITLVDGALRSIAQQGAVLRHDVIRPAPTVGLSAIFGSVSAEGHSLAGQKWVSETASGVTATLLLNDGETGELSAIMNASALTGLRTAAVSGACIAALGGAGPVAIVGTGLQCRWHLRILEALGRHDVRVAYRRHESGEAIRAWAATATPSVTITLTDSIENAVRDAATVITMVTRGATGCIVDPVWLSDDVLILPVDFAHCIDGRLASGAAKCAADDPDNFEHVRATGELPDYPPISLATGAILAEASPPGRIVIQNLGNSACDLVIANHIRQAALAAGEGVWLER